MRLERWEQNLWHVTNAALKVPFEYGKNDCCLFAADCILAITGEDLAAEFRGTYSNEREALKLMLSLDCRDIGDVASRYLPEIKVSKAQRGDIVMFPNVHGDNCLAVVAGITAVGPTRRGMLHNPKNTATRAWKVG